MALSEAFPRAVLNYQGTSYKRVVQKEVTDCSEAGRNGFGEILVDNNCAKVLRATYVDSAQQYAMTVGVAVLPTESAAEKVIGGMDVQNGVWFEALPGDGGSGAEEIHRSPGYGARANVGRYVIFSFAALSNGEKPPEELSGLTDWARKRIAQNVMQRARTR